MNGINALIKEIPEFPKPFHLVRIKEPGPGREPSPDHAGNQTSDFQTLELKNKFAVPQ